MPNKPWKILHLDVSEGLPALSCEPGVEGLFVVFWTQDIPLGHRRLLAEQLPLSAAQVAETAVQAIAPAVGDHLLEHGFEAPMPEVAEEWNGQQAPPDLRALMRMERPLEALQGHLSLPETPPALSLSVVICTCNRPEALHRCLHSLDELTQPPQEIVVVDNAPSTEATRQLIDQRPDVRYVAEPRPGLSAARNAGLRQSTGDIVAFTDDDVTVHPNWTARLQCRFADPAVQVVTGLILPAELETKAQLLFQQGHSGFGWGYRALTFDASFVESTKKWGTPVWRIGAGANMAFRRSVFEQVGGFDERLGAGTAGCSEDSELWYRVLAEGGSCHYDPTIVVYHCHRRTMSDLRHQMHQYMRGHVAALLIQFARYRHWGNLYRLLGSLPAYYLRTVLRRLLQKSDLRSHTWGAQVRGCLDGVKYYLQHWASEESCEAFQENPLEARSR